MQTVRQMAGERPGIPLLHTPQKRPEEWWENVKSDMQQTSLLKLTADNRGNGLVTKHGCQAGNL